MVKKERSTAIGDLTMWVSVKLGHKIESLALRRQIVLKRVEM
jgi:hypothetical protein